jgi:uracil phosphoribosyltransferase
LPKDLDDHYILVLDPLLGTGSTVTMAIRLLLDHNIPQEKIIFINLISSPQGVDMVTYTFPKVRRGSVPLSSKFETNYAH